MHANREKRMYFKLTLMLLPFFPFTQYIYIFPTNLFSSHNHIHTNFFLLLSSNNTQSAHYVHMKTIDFHTIFVMDRTNFILLHCWLVTLKHWKLSLQSKETLCYRMTKKYATSLKLCQILTNFNKMENYKLFELAAMLKCTYFSNHSGIKSSINKH